MTDEDTCVEVIESTTKSRAGRHTIYKSQYAEELSALSGSGMTIAQICAKWGISERIFYYWRKDHHEFREQFEIGRTAHKGFMEGLLIDNITNRNFNSIGWSMMMRTMHNYTETRVIELVDLEKSESLTDKAKCIMNAVSDSTVTPLEGNTMIMSLATIAKISIETDVQEKLQALTAITTKLEEEK